jgi:hypothetical protein
MGLWSAPCNDFKKVLIAAGGARQHHLQCNGSTKRGVIVKARTASPRNKETFTLFKNDDALCGSKSARWRCRVFFTKEWMRT